MDSTRATLRFDRGTIVCDGLPETARVPGDGALTWDPRIRRYRARASDLGAVRSLLREAGIPFDDAVGAPLLTSSWSDVPLRPYQRAAVTAWQLGGARGLVVLPTGGGKTRVAIAAIAERAVATLVLVPTRVLMHQWRDVLGEFYGGEVGVLGDGLRETRGVTIATFESGRRGMHRFGNRFELLVVDEAHHFGTGAAHEVLEMCIAPARLGLTATPPEAEPLERLVELLGPVRYELQVADLVGRFLADFEVIEMRLELTSAERAAYDEAREVFTAVWHRFSDLAPGGNWQDFVRTCQQTPVGRDALRAWRRARKIASWTAAKSAALGRLLDRHRDSRTLVFTGDRDAAQEIARDQWIMPITADTPRKERERALAAFRAGELRALVSARVLNEGIDVPAADVGIVVGSSQGAREYVQRVGRVLRPQEGKRALVYELVSARTTEVRQAWRRKDALGAGESRALHGP